MNEKQKEAFDLVTSRKNLFISGSAGTGKSFTLKYVQKWAWKNHINLALTSTSGNSALLIGGRTIHSYLSIGLARKTAEQLYEDVINKNPHTVRKINMLDVLVIDEISMMDHILFGKINSFLKLVRKNDLEFGGIQVLFMGDFCQLPPINGDYCFKSESWDKLNIETIMLTQIMRQNDSEFIDILEELRWGKCTADIRRKLKQLKNTIFPDDGILPTVLYSKNVDVDNINSSEYSNLLKSNPDRKIFKTTTSNKYWSQSLKIPETVDVCVDAQVMVTWNIDLDNNIANGSRGVVIGFSKNSVNIKLISGDIVNIPYVTIDDQNMSCTFMPLKLAWATTIHRSQGQSIDRLIINIQDVWENGQAYVAISRARDMKYIKIEGDVKSKCFKCSADVIKFYGV